MHTLLNHFNDLFPSFAVKDILNEYVITESSNEEKENCFRKFVIRNINGWKFPFDMPSKASSFYCLSQGTHINSAIPCLDVMREDCDGIFCIEEAGKLILYVCELKSSFTSYNITKAKDQIVGSFLKTLHMLSMLQGFNYDDIEMRGLIIAYKPNVERLSSFKSDNRKDAFCIQLNKEGNYTMPISKCQHYWNPLEFHYDIQLKYIAVPVNQSEFSIDFDNIRS